MNRTLQQVCIFCCLTVLVSSVGVFIFSTLRTRFDSSPSVINGDNKSFVNSTKQLYVDYSEYGKEHPFLVMTGPIGTIHFALNYIFERKIKNNTKKSNFEISTQTENIAVASRGDGPPPSPEESWIFFWVLKHFHVYSLLPLVLCTLVFFFILQKRLREDAFDARLRLAAAVLRNNAVVHRAPRMPNRGHG